MTKRQQEAEAGLQDQENLLPRKQLVLTFSVLALTLLVYFVDQNGIGQLLPTVAKDLNAANTISWAGTSALIGNTTFQVLYGRLSDIFGRKVVYLSAVGLLCFSDLMCGISRNAPMLYVFRGLTGIAGGGITSLSMMIVSDVVTLERRGKYQGILGSMVGFGNLIGPLLAATFAEIHYWRGLYYVLAPVAATCGFIAWYFLPSTPPMGNFQAQVKKIDYWGVTTASIGLILILIPISGAGSYFEWKSPMVISMLVIGGIFCIIFIYVEVRVATLPMMPMSLFYNHSVAAMLFQNFFFGMVFYNYLYYLPIYYQNVRRYSPIKSALMTLPLVLMQSCTSISSGQYISRRKRYGEIIWIGFFLFTLGTALATLFNRTIPTYGIILSLIVLGIANGCCFQPTLIALQAHCVKSQRAVVTSVRNFLRCLGGSIGLAISAAILQTVLRAQLPEEFKYLSHSTYTKPDYSKFTPAQGDAILDAYEKASHMVFVFMTPCAALCFLACMFVKDRGLTRPDEVVKSESGDSDEESKGAVVTEKEMLQQRDLSVHSLDSKDVDEKEDLEKSGVLDAEKIMEVGQLGIPQAARSA